MHSSKLAREMGRFHLNKFSCGLWTKDAAEVKLSSDQQWVAVHSLRWLG